MTRPIGPRARFWLIAATVVTVVLVAGCSAQAEQPFATKATPTLSPETRPLTPSATAMADPGAASASEPAAGADQPTAAPQPPTAAPETAAPQAALPVTVAPNESVYRVEIPRLGVSLPIAEGDVRRDVDNAQTPEDYAFHLPGTAMFGAGNTYIYAHARPGMFLSLWNARIGDLVIVRTPVGTLLYIVAEIHPRVPPTQISWAGPTADTRLTLQTSTGPNGGDPRFVVVARPG